MIGIDKTTNKLVSGGILNETQQAFNNAKAILEEVGSSLDKGMNKIQISNTLLL